MDQQNSRPISISNTFDKMWLDSLHSTQPSGTYRKAFSAVNTSEDAVNFGLTNEKSNEINVSLQGHLIGLLQVEERDQFVSFTQVGGKTEIGIITPAKNKYEKVVTTEGVVDWINSTYKIDSVNDLRIYWSENNYYKTVNLDESCDNHLIEPLIKCDTTTPLKIVREEGGNLPNGAYWFSFRLKDKDGNHTNFFKISDKNFAAGGDFVAGENSGHGFSLSFEIVGSDYSLADICVISKIDGVTRVSIVDTIGVSVGLNSFYYSQVLDDQFDIQIEEVISRNNRYIRGHNLTQFDNRLILYNIIPNRKLNYQAKALEIKPYYYKYPVPVEFADRFQALRDYEKYQIAIRWNYCDQTSSDDFIIAGPEVNNSLVENGCKDCLEPYFKVHDTSERLELYLADVDDAGRSGSGEDAEVLLDREITFPKASSLNIGVEEDRYTGIETRASDDNGDLPAFDHPWACEGDVFDPEVCPCEDGSDSPCDPPAEYNEETLDKTYEVGNKLLSEAEEKHLTSADEVKNTDTGKPCSENGDVYCKNGNCYECINNTWHYKNNADDYIAETVVERSAGGGNRSSGVNEYQPEIIYEEDGCTVKEIKPKKYSKGLFGGYETTYVYPDTIDSDCEFLFGDLRGKPKRLLVAPGGAKEPNFVSFSHGVPTTSDVGNDPDVDSFVFMTGIGLENIVFPEDPPKPLDEYNPYTITYVQRTPENTSVLGTGWASSTFKGIMGNREYLFPKLGMNSLEFFDKHIKPSGKNLYRGGFTNTDKTVYTVHSPDLHLYKPNLNATHCIFDRELRATGMRHGLYAAGEKSKNLFTPTYNQKGARTDLFISKSVPLSEAKFRCVKTSSRVLADTILRDNTIDTPLCNLKRESCTYVELGDNEHFEPFENSAEPAHYGGGNGKQSIDIVDDFATDYSFMGDTMDHECYIHDAKAHQVTLIKDLPGQYGSVINQTYIPIGLKTGGESVDGLVGDSFAGGFAVKRTSWVSDKTLKDITLLELGLVDSIFDAILEKNFVLIDIKPKEFKIFRWKFTVPGVTVDLTPTVHKIVNTIKWLLAAFFRIIGYDTCGKLPRSKDKGDHRNYAGGLRGNPNGFKSGAFDVYVVKDDYNGYSYYGPNAPVPVPANRGNKDIPDDAYYPGVAKFNIYGYFGANHNHNYRQIGAQQYGSPVQDLPGIAEVHGRNLGIFSMDSVFTGTNWPQAYINRNYITSNEPPRVLILLRVFLHIIWTFGPGIYLAGRGWWNIVEAVSSLYIDAVIAGSNIYGIIISIIIGYILILAGIAWITTWVLSGFDTKIIDEMLNLDECKPDLRFADASYGVSPDKYKQFEDNFFRYNLDYSSANIYEFGLGISDPYKTEELTEYDNSFLYSEPQVPGSDIDSWRNFKMNNYLKVPIRYGKITNIFQLSDRLFLHTTDNIVRVAQGSESIITQGGTELYLGAGTLFGDPKPIFGGVVEGFAGLKDPNAARVTAAGYIFPDRDAGDWYNFTLGGGIQSMGEMGVSRFLKNNMQFELLKQFPDYKNVDTKMPNSIGYSFGVDNYLNRYLITKIDYKCINDSVELVDGVLSMGGQPVDLSDSSCFENKSYTLSYDYSQKKWVSFHYYTPLVYTWNRYDMFSFDDQGMWRHNSHQGHQSFYGKRYPFTVEYVVNNLKEQAPFKYVSTILNTEMYRKDGDQLLNVDETFNKILSFNSHQSSGILPLVKSNDLSMIDTSTEDDERVLTMFKNRYWTFKDINDRLIDNNQKLFLYSPTNDVDVVNEANISPENKKNIFFDNYLSNRLIYDIFTDKKLFIKSIQTLIKNQSI